MLYSNISMSYGDNFQLRITTSDGSKSTESRAINICVIGNVFILYLSKAVMNYLPQAISTSGFGGFEWMIEVNEGYREEM